MATIDEVLAAMPDTAAAVAFEYLTIDPVTRKITVPEAERIFGVTSDEVAVRKYFQCPRYVGDGLDLAGMFLQVNFRNANNEEDAYLVDDVEVSGEFITFSWLLSAKVTAYKGAVQFGVCADLPNTAEKKRPDWNTTIASGDVLEGLDPDSGDVEGETSDVVTQLREMVTAQTAAVEATGADQVQAVHAAATAAGADAQAQIEAKGAATLATIPEDYTALAGKTNEQANAIKGHLSGEIVQTGDVSPVEHYLGVKVHGKNLFNIGALEVMPENYGVRISSIDLESNAFTITTADTHSGNGYCGLTNGAGNYAPTLRDLCPQMVAGRTYVLSGVSSTATKTLYLRGVNRSWVFGTALAITEEHLSAKLAFYGLNSAGGEGTGDCTISNLQIEEGTEATVYTPYIDPAGVTVTRCGKNLLNSNFMKDQATLNGVTITREGDLLTLNGTLTVDSVLFSTSFFLHGVINNHYTLSYKYIGGKVEGTSSVCVGDCVAAGAARQSWANIKMLNNDNSFTLKLLNPYIKDLWFYSMAGVVFTDYKIKIQLETGKSATEFEASTSATAMPDERGAVTGLPSAAPTMTLLTDTAGVTIDCTYNRDSNAVYAELLAKIAALGGTI